MSGERTPRETASLRRLERKVDANARTLASVAERQDKLNLNGSVDALHALAEGAPSLLILAKATPVLLKLAEAAPVIIAAVERDAEWRTWWKVTKAILNPLRPLGAFTWAVIVSVAALVISRHLP